MAHASQGPEGGGALRSARSPVNFNLARRGLDALSHPTFYGGRPQRNAVYDWNQLQGVYNAADLHLQQIRDIDHRHVSIENSSPYPVGVAITTYMYGETPAVRWVSPPGDVRHVGINAQGDTTQYMWVLHPETGARLGPPQVLDRQSNQFVIRYGLNTVWVQKYQRPSYSAAF